MKSPPLYAVALLSLFSLSVVSLVDAQFNPQDVADQIESMSASDAATLLEGYTVSQQSEIMNYVESSHAGAVVEAIGDPSVAAGILKGMAVDKASGLLGNVASGYGGEVLEAIGDSSVAAGILKGMAVDKASGLLGNVASGYGGEVLEAIGDSSVAAGILKGMAVDKASGLLGNVASGYGGEVLEAIGDPSVAAGILKGMAVDKASGLLGNVASGYGGEVLEAIGDPSSVGDILGNMDLSTATDLLSSMGLDSSSLADVLGGMGLDSSSLADVLGGMGLDSSSLADVLGGMGLDSSSLADVLGGMGLDSSSLADVLGGMGLDSSSLADVLGGMGLDSSSLGDILSGMDPSVVGDILSGMDPSVVSAIGSIHIPHIPYLSLSDGDPPCYESIDFASIEDAYEFSMGSLTEVSGGGPDAEIDISPDEFLWDVDKGEYHCIKTLVLDLNNCEKVGGSIDEAEYDVVVAQERLFRRMEMASELITNQRLDVYAGESLAIARCMTESDVITGETGGEQEVEVVIHPTKLTLLASKTTYDCGQYATEWACAEVAPHCRWNAAADRCVFVPTAEFGRENQSKYWFLENDHCFIVDKKFCGDSKEFHIIHDTVYKALMEHYLYDDYYPPAPPIPGTFYHIKHFYDSDLIYATFFEKWAKFLGPKELWGVHDSERMQCYKTNWSDTPTCHDMSYPAYSFTDTNELFRIDDKYILDAVLWNKFQYINEMPDEDIVEVERRTSFNHDFSGHLPLPSRPLGLWEIIWTKIFVVVPELLDVSGKAWTMPRENVSFYDGHGQNREDSCEFSCDGREDCDLLPFCGPPYDPMDKDEVAIEKCGNAGLDGVLETPTVLCDVFKPCTPVRGASGECNEDEIPCECAPFGAGVQGDCWSVCKIVAQHKIMLTDEEHDVFIAGCEETGFGDPGFEKRIIFWYPHQWGPGYSLMPCYECENGMIAVNEDYPAKKRLNTPPSCLERWVFDGGLRGITSFTLPYSDVKDLPEGELVPLDLVRVAPNIWEISYTPPGRDRYEILVIDTGNIPFDITCAYISRSGDTYTITRFYKADKWLRLNIDSDADFNFELLDSAPRLDIDALHNFFSGLRRDKFYTACDRYTCNCDDCGSSECVGCPAPCIFIPFYRFCVADESWGGETCGGVSEKVTTICWCYPIILDGCTPCIPSCTSKFREEIETEYYPEVIHVSDHYAVENVEKDEWRYNDDDEIEHKLVFEASRHKEGDVISTNGFVNFSMYPNLFRGMTMVAADSQIDYQHIITPVLHELWGKKSSPGPDRIDYLLDDKYGYDSEEFYFPEQCRNTCPAYPACDCAPDDIMRPLCMRLDEELVYAADTDDLLCAHFYPDMSAAECKNNVIRGGDHERGVLCNKYMNEIGRDACELEFGRVECFDRFSSDSLYMKCYGEYSLYFRDDCVCPPNDCFDNPCGSERNFHEEEGSIVVNGDFEMGFEPDARDRLGPWERESGNSEVVWRGNNGYTLKMHAGDVVKQRIPEETYHRFQNNPSRNQLCLDYGLFIPLGGSIIIDISTVDDSMQHAIPIGCCSLGWHHTCITVPFSNITEIKLTASGVNVLIDNVNLGKYLDFVKFVNYPLTDLEFMDFSPAQTTGGSNRLLVVDTKNGTSPGADHDWYYYTIYFRTADQPYIDSDTGDEVYDIVGRDEFSEGDLTVYTYFKNYTLPLSDADKFKIRDAVELSYSIEPHNKVIWPGTEVEVTINLFDLDEGVGVVGEKVYVSSNYGDFSLLNPSAEVLEEDGRHYVVTGAGGDARFTIQPDDVVYLRFKYYGSEDPTGPVREKMTAINVVTFKSPLLSPEIIGLLLILVVAVFSYRFLMTRRMDFISWWRDLMGKE